MCLLIGTVSQVSDVAHGPLVSILEYYAKARGALLICYVFSMAGGTIGEWLKLVPFLLGDEQFILRGGGGGGVFF